MKKIFIPFAISNRNENARVPLHFVRETYLEQLRENNLMPVLVSAVSGREMLEQTYQETAGILLTGGSDINPKLYGEMQPHSETHVNEPTRDTFEIEIVKWALRDRKPILAICRGCQVLAVASGGSLYQHIPDIVPEIEEKHTASCYADLLDHPIFHEVILENGSHIAEILGRDRIMANTAHHQSVKTAGNDFIISGKTKRGIVEVIEHKDKSYFCFGIQSHPEVGTNDLAVLFQKFKSALFSRE